MSVPAATLTDAEAQAFALSGAALSARGSGALWWEDERLLCVADLHLGRSGRLARRGGPLLPPYETEATLDRLAAEIAHLDPAVVICLGDSFDDDASVGELAPAALARLATLMAGRHWVWVSGNHDPAPVTLGGAHTDLLAMGPLTFRHEARSGDVSGEISGHYHPKLRLSLRGRQIARACFLQDARRVILPAFGAYTGGLAADHPALAGLIGADGAAILTGDPCLRLPLAGLRGPAR